MPKTEYKLPRWLDHIVTIINTTVSRGRLLAQKNQRLCYIATRAANSAITLIGWICGIEFKRSALCTGVGTAGMGTEVVGSTAGWNQGM